MASASNHLDVNALNELKEVMGDEFSLLIETFLNDSVTRVETIQQALATGEADQIRRAAHSFKGSASNMGAIHLAAKCRDLEEMGKDGQLGGAEALFEEIKAEFEQVKVAMASV
jgi:HPt (histidine-containing phosphotransfer) domain-containing protein